MDEWEGRRRGKEGGKRGGNKRKGKRQWKWKKRGRRGIGMEPPVVVRLVQLN